jgi:hypothetical protein
MNRRERHRRAGGLAGMRAGAPTDTTRTGARRTLALVFAPLVASALAATTPTVAAEDPLPRCAIMGRAIAVAAGSDHALALHGDGMVWAWGANGHGQLGDGTATTRTTPVHVRGVNDIVAIAADGAHSMAIRADGTLWEWGSGPSIASTTPLQRTGLANVVDVSSGSTHTIALTADGRVWTWGTDNGAGQMGNGTTVANSSPTPVPGLTSITDVAAGWTHSLAVKDGAEAFAWGSNDSGELGDGSTTGRLSPVALTTLGDVRAVDAGQHYSTALKADGTLWSWGSGQSGRLGNGTGGDRTTPGQVAGLAAVTAVSVGDEHSLAIKADGTTWAWGENANGELGDGTTASRSAPVAVDADGSTSIAAGRTFSAAVRGGGATWSWGSDATGQLGNGTDTSRTRPGPVHGMAQNGACLPVDVVEPAPAQPHPSQRCRAGGTVVVLDVRVGGADADLRLGLASPERVELCFRVEGLGAAAGGMVTVTPGVPLVDVGGGVGPGLGVPSWDTDSTACSTTTPNRVPGNHPIVAGGVAGVPLLLDAYTNGPAVWVCLEVGPLAKARVIVPITLPTVGRPGAVVTPAAVVTFTPDPDTPGT